MTLPGKQQLSPGDAFEDLRKSLRLRKKMGEQELFVPLAEIESRSGRPQEALRILEQGLAWQDRRVGAWVQLARVKSRLGRLDEALGHYRHILNELDERNLPALRVLANSALAAGDAKLARTYLDRWRGINPRDPELEDLAEEVEVMVNPESDTKIAVQGHSTQKLLDMSLDELEPGYIPAPSVQDESAWLDTPRVRAARAGGGKP